MAYAKHFPPLFPHPFWNTDNLITLLFLSITGPPTLKKKEIEVFSVAECDIFYVFDLHFSAKKYTSG